MSRPLRIDVADVCYHTMARGNARQPIFLDDDDRQFFLTDLWRIAGRREWRVLAYCLMPNHYHLLIKTRRPTLVRGMRDLNGCYAQRFNRRYDRVGHLFQGRYKAILVEEAGYLSELARYIVLNPVRAGLCRRPDGWEWSSYKSTAGVGRAEPLEWDLILRQFGGDLDQARLAYRRFVAAGIGRPAPAPTAAHPLVAGSDRFASAFAREATSASLEVPRAERRFETPADLARHASSRNEAIRLAHESGLYTLGEIGRCFGLGPSMVGKIVRPRRSTDSLGRHVLAIEPSPTIQE